MSRASPLQVAVVDQQTHQFRHGDGGVGVVEQRGQCGSPPQAALIEAAQHVLQGAAHEEVLLLQAQPTSFIGAVVGVKHLGEVSLPTFSSTAP